MSWKYTIPLETDMAPYAIKYLVTGNEQATGRAFVISTSCREELEELATGIEQEASLREDTLDGAAKVLSQLAVGSRKRSVLKRGQAHIPDRLQLAVEGKKLRSMVLAI